jgi:hypothetical protein
MTTHLQRELRALGAAEAAAASTAPVHVHTMVRAVRRRRAARKAATGAVVTGAAAAVAVGGVQLSGLLGSRTGPSPAASPELPTTPSPEVTPEDDVTTTPTAPETTEPEAPEPPVVADPDAIFPACGAALPEDATPTEADLLLATVDVADGATVSATTDLTTSLTAPSSQYVLANVPTWADAVLLRDDVVVSLAEIGEADVQLVDIRPGAPAELATTYTFAPCPGAEAVLDGPLDLVVTAPVNLKEVDGESRSDALRVTSAPVTITLD